MQKILTKTNFILEIIQLYQSSRKTRYAHEKIKRGRSHSVSSLAEDLFAKYLVENIECDEIYVDQPVSVVGVKKVSYPDIVVVRGDTIIGTCDLKVDLGWNREGLVELCKKSFEYLKEIQGKECKINNGLITKEIKNYKVSKKFFHNIVVISDKNINTTNLEEQRKEVKKKFGSLVNVFILSGGVHLNTYGVTAKNLMEKVTIRESEFDELLKTFSK